MKGVATGGCAALLGVLGITPPATSASASSPIQHVIVMYQENHSFDNLLGNWCAATGHCVGMPAAVTLKGGVLVTPTQAPAIVPQASHTVAAQQAAIDGGAMDGWASVPGCAAPSYSCISYYTPAQIPNLINLATNFAISDMTFSEADSPSFGGHLYAVAATTDGFLGDIPQPAAAGPGWGCDSHKTTSWVDPSTHKVLQEPSCVPDPALSNPNGGAFRATPVAYVPTIMDRLDAAKLPWRIYAANVPTPSPGTYAWSTCPSFAECLDTSQRQDLVPTDQILADAAAGALPAFSLVLPSPVKDSVSGGASQHNGDSITIGDNWIGKLTAALEASPEWSSTALFITYDDCGCFYDQVAPGTNPDGSQQGARVPLVIVSPYAVAGYVDSTPTTFAGILAFTEQTFGLAPLGVNDKDAYPFTNAFNYAQVPLAPVRMAQSPVPPGARMDGAADGDDPT